MTDIYELNKSLVTRLVKYQRVLRKLKSLGFVKVFSNNLADAIGVTAAVVRKDFSLIGVPGNKRGGYTIETLAQDLTTILGDTPEKNIIIVGCGRIGTALMSYGEFQREDMHILAGFDLNPKNHDHLPVPVYPMTELKNFAKTHTIEVAVLAVPDTAAITVFDDLINAGIRGILNFTSVELKCNGRCERPHCKRNCTVSSVNIGLEIENLFYLINLESKVKTKPMDIFLHNPAAEELEV